MYIGELEMEQEHIWKYAHDHNISYDEAATELNREEDDD